MNTKEASMGDTHVTRVTRCESKAAEVPQRCALFRSTSANASAFTCLLIVACNERCPSCQVFESTR